MDLGSYCQEGEIDCLIMIVSSLLLSADTIRLIVQIIQTSRYNFCRSQSNNISHIKQQRGKERKLVFLFKIIGVLLIMGINIAQVVVWVDLNKKVQSIILLQMFSINIFSACLWICALFQDKQQKGYTKPWTQFNMHMNLLCNIFIAIIGARNTIDNNGDVSFYSYLGYIGGSGILQIYIKLCQKDYESILFDDLDSKNSSDFSIEGQKNTAARTTKIDPNGLTERFISEETMAVQERLKKQISQNNSSENNSSVPNNNKKGDRKSSNSKLKKTHQNPEDIQKKNDVEKQQIEDQEYNNQIIRRYSDFVDEDEETKLCKSRIENIRIEKFLETIKYSKKTIVYEIKCTYQGKLYSIKRSFREFGVLNNTIKQKYKNKKIPHFPVKKAQNSILTFPDLEERKKQLCQYLQNVNQICEPEDLIDFMIQTDQQTSSHTNNNSQQQSRNQRRSSEENQNNSNSNSYNSQKIDIIWEEDEEINNSTSTIE